VLDWPADWKQLGWWLVVLVSVVNDALAAQSLPRCNGA